MTEDTKAFCTKCGASIPPDSQFCSECGNPVDRPDMMYSQGSGYSGNSGYPGYSTDSYGMSNLIKARAERRLTFVNILLIGYVIMGILSAILGFSYDSILRVIESDPALIDMISPEDYDMLVSLKDVMFVIGVVFLISALSVLVSLILSIMKRMHMAAVAACAIGSLVTVTMLLFGVMDGVFLVLIGLAVTYLLYTTKPAFID